MKRWIRSFAPALALAVVVAAGVAVVGNGLANAQVPQQLIVKTTQQVSPPTATPETGSTPQGTEQPEANEPQGSEQPEANEAEANEPDEASEVAALASKASITAQQAEQVALAANPGATVVKTELDDENGTIIYSVDLSTGAEVKVDAQNGAIVGTEQAGDEGKDDGEHEDGVQDSATQTAPVK